MDLCNQNLGTVNDNQTIQRAPSGARRACKGNRWARKGNQGPCNRNRVPFIYHETPFDCTRSSYDFQKNDPRVHNFFAILGPEMAAPILWTRGKIEFFLQENPCP